MQNASQSAVLLISCPDQPGLVAAITRFIAEHHGNILHLDQHVDMQENVFFMRVEWDLSGFTLPPDAISETFSRIAEPLRMNWRLRFSDQVPRMAVFVSKEAHCLYEILARYQAGEWNVTIPLIVSNHAALEPIAQKFGIEFRLFPITTDTKLAQEAAQIALLQAYQIDVVVLARYMQILTPAFVEAFPNRIINIHHSFLPAFVGAKPYHAAFSRGVKIIGATSHYVTGDLDAGPILEQDTVRISHKDSVEDLIRKGKDVEKLVLSRAIRYHLQSQVLVYNNKTVIFG
ncbi:MAG: formyltetrahydrofolate deformylase [bacterium]|nr:formyltetrahydrofolate deformylase [bacterium]